jgi:hypothetical protein
VRVGPWAKLGLVRFFFKQRRAMPPFFSMRIQDRERSPPIRMRAQCGLFEKGNTQGKHGRGRYGTRERERRVYVRLFAQ